MDWCEQLTLISQPETLIAGPALRHHFCEYIGSWGTQTTPDTQLTEITADVLLMNRKSCKHCRRKICSKHQSKYKSCALHWGSTLSSIADRSVNVPTISGVTWGSISKRTSPQSSESKPLRLCFVLLPQPTCKNFFIINAQCVYHHQSLSSFM